MSRITRDPDGRVFRTFEDILRRLRALETRSPSGGGDPFGELPLVQSSGAVTGISSTTYIDLANQSHCQIPDYTARWQDGWRLWVRAMFQGTRGGGGGSSITLGWLPFSVDDGNNGSTALGTEIAEATIAGNTHWRLGPLAMVPGTPDRDLLTIVPRVKVSTGINGQILNYQLWGTWLPA